MRSLEKDKVAGSVNKSVNNDYVEAECGYKGAE